MVLINYLGELGKEILLILMLGVTFVQGHGQITPLPTNSSIDLPDSVLSINRILISGNDKTRGSIILRELSLHEGDTISRYRLEEVTLQDRNKIYNLRLFNTVSIEVLTLSSGQMIDLIVTVTERWYTFPAPIFELSDRNFNEWWENYNHDFRRVNWGLRLYQYNFRGRNETVRLTAQFGYTKRFELNYRIPNLTRDQKHGITINVDYNEPKNLAYYTDDHKLSFLELRKTTKKTVGGYLTYTFRKSFYQTHSLSYLFRNSNIIDSVAQLNPNYYHNESKHQRFQGISYTFNSDHRDVAAYPLHGFQFIGFLNKVGLGKGDVNQFELNLTFARYFDLNKNNYLSNFTSLYYSTPNDQPYSLYGALGYRQQIIRGYEVSVIEGPKFVLNKTTFKKRIFSRVWEINGIPIDQFKYFPVSIYAKVYTDVGYIENYPMYEENGINTRLSNRFLVGSGAGIDLVLLYDTVLRFEYTFTREKTNGLFFHIKREF